MNDLSTVRTTLADHTATLLDDAAGLVHQVRPLALEAAHAGAGAVQAGRRAVQGSVPHVVPARRRGVLMPVLLFAVGALLVGAWRMRRREDHTVTSTMAGDRR